MTPDEMAERNRAFASAANMIRKLVDAWREQQEALMEIASGQHSKRGCVNIARRIVVAPAEGRET